MFRFVIVILAAIGLGALIFGESPAAAAGLLLLVPLFFIFKVMLFFLFFGAISSAMWRRGGGGFGRGSRHRGWHPTWQQAAHREGEDVRTTQSPEDRFEEWHRMAHARDEVDSWAPDEI